MHGGLGVHGGLEAGIVNGELGRLMACSRMQKALPKGMGTQAAQMHTYLHATQRHMRAHRHKHTRLHTCAGHDLVGSWGVGLLLVHVFANMCSKRWKMAPLADASLSHSQAHPTARPRLLPLLAPSDHLPLLPLTCICVCVCVWLCTQACGQWDKALEVAEKHDRIHLKTTHYAHAQVSRPGGRRWGHMTASKA